MEKYINKSATHKTVPPMKKTNIMKFSWGSLPTAALDPQTIRQLRVIATRERTSVEQVMSKALDWILATPERSSAKTHN